MATCMIWIHVLISYDKRVQREKYMPYTKFHCHIGKDVVGILHGGQAFLDWCFQLFLNTEPTQKPSQIV